MQAPAKVNLFLHVTGRRADGYHQLESLVAFADVGDEITVSPSRSLELKIDGPFACGLASDQSNLVMRAAFLLKEATGVKDGATIRLTKELPIASGIGGGSSDAAAALTLLCALWQVALNGKRLNDLALSLGADVPVCLTRRPSLVSGIGEVVRPMTALPTAWLLLANPGVATPTQQVFKARTGVFSAPLQPFLPPNTFRDLVDCLNATRNDLTDAAMSVAPAIGDVLRSLSGVENCRIARLSGSGATCFGLFETEAGARAGEKQLRDARPAWWVRAAPLLR